ncbi:putative peptidoglycan-binding domain-containing protein [Pantoea sp. B65]|uniref:putative peptidoglycan-binding domain-containing protein n=1 Tax=Pantoea sp. B65 TaxID=2813359 RepID=UPI0039B56AC7
MKRNSKYNRSIPLHVTCRVNIFLYYWLDKEIQKLLNSEFGQSLAIDGVIGPKTIAAMNSVPEPANLTSRIADIRKNYYRDLADSDPINASNINGWLKRVDRCAKAVIK